MSRDGKTTLIPILLLVLLSQTGDLRVEQIQFRTMETCRAAAAQLEHELAPFNARAVCLERAP